MSDGLLRCVAASRALDEDQMRAIARFNHDSPSVIGQTQLNSVDSHLGISYGPLIKD